MNDDSNGAASGKPGPAGRTKRTCGTGTETYMGDRGEGLSSGGVPGRRRGPGGPLSVPREVRDAAALEAVLAAAIRTDDLAPQAEERAVAAFRAARDTGAHRADTRRRDDWRPAEERRPRRSLRVTFGVVFAGISLGGVAVAAIGSVGSPARGGGADRGTTHPSAPAPDRPGDAASPAPSGGPRPTDGPAPAQDTEAHCRAYEQVQGHGAALDATAWQQLVTAAGGKDEVAAYCSEQLRRTAEAPGRSAGTGKSGEGTADAGHGAADGAGASGRTVPSGNSSSGGTDNTAGKGQAGGGPGGKPK